MQAFFSKGRTFFGPTFFGPRTAQATEHAESAVVDVGNIGAAVLAGGAGIELGDVVEET